MRACLALMAMGMLGCAAHEPEESQEPDPEVEPDEPDEPFTPLAVAADEPAPCLLFEVVSPRHCEGHTFDHQLHFDANEAYPRDDAETDAAIAAMVETLASAPAEPVAVVVHTSAQGSDAYNARLTDARARALVEILDARGADASRLQPIGAGERYTIIGNGGCDRSRRVELWRTAAECSPPASATP